MNKISRRKVLQSLSLLPFPLSAGFWSKTTDAATIPEIYFLTVQTSGAWDVTLFCDPKENKFGEKEITHWSNNDETQEIGNLNYAPFAKNEEFFQKYYKDILIINGVDAQTNSHTVGITNNWSGRTAAGYPSLPALYASTHGESLPLSYLSFGGGYSYTASQISAAMVGHPGSIKNLLLPNRTSWDGQIKINKELWKLIQAENIASLESQIATSNNQESISRRRDYINAFGNSERLKALGNTLPSDNDLNKLSRFKGQIQVALSAFSANTTITADIAQDGYDTHENNDNQQRDLLSELVDGLDFLWEQAETLGIADKLFVMVGSDFGRTPYYNANNGKDHWNIGSYMFMKRNADFTNQVIGETDSLHNALGVNAENLKSDGSSPTINPTHIHNSLRQYLGITGSKVDQLFPLNSEEKYHIFT